MSRGLVGTSNQGSISNSYSTGVVGGSDGVGGLVGQSYLSPISNSYASGAVTANSRNRICEGDLVGQLLAGSISASFATGSVKDISATGGTALGGLVGGNSGTITDSYAMGAVSGKISGRSGRVGGRQWRQRHHLLFHWRGYCQYRRYGWRVAGR